MSSAIEQYPHLLAADTLGGRGIARPLGGLIARALSRNAEAIANLSDLPMPSLGFIIQARQHPRPARLARYARGTNENFHLSMHTLDGIRRQKYDQAMTKVLLVVNEDEKPTNRHDLHLAGLQTPDDGLLAVDVQTLPVSRDTSHAQALNLAAHHIVYPGNNTPSPDMVMITEAGARYATDQAARTTAWAVTGGAKAVFGTRLSDKRASWGESLLYNASALINRKAWVWTPSRSPQPGAGFLAVDRAGFATGVLQYRSFDETYARGGSDGQLGMKLQAGEPQSVWYHPAASVQYTLGANLLDLKALLQEWGSYAQPNDWPPQPPHPA